MATKKNDKSAEKPKAAAKKEPAKKAAKAAPAAATTARHPHGRVKAGHGSKDDLVKKIVEPLAAEDQDTEALSERLRKASNAQLLRLLRVVETVKQKYGSRAKLIEAVGKAVGKAKDKDYVAKLGTFSLPRLLDLARGNDRRAA